MPCKVCIEIKKGRDEIPDCASCIPPILEENLSVMYLIEKYFFIFISDGKIQSEGISLALNENWIKETDKASYTNKIIIYVKAFLQAYSEDI